MVRFKTKKHLTLPLINPKIMKIQNLIWSIGLLVLAGCGTTYQSGGSSDAVYFPSGSQQPDYTANDNSQNTQARKSNSNQQDDNHYVTYDNNGDQTYSEDEYYNDDGYSDYEEGYDDGYTNGYYSRRIMMFDRPGGLFSYNYYMMNRPFYGGSYLWNGFGYNSMGWFHNPYMWRPGISLGLGFGSPYLYGGWYSSLYNPYYGFGYPYYGYGGYYGGKYGYDYN